MTGQLWDPDVWRVVFDVAVHSMDFGSGFLDDSEVAALRKAAGILGVDPDSATPGNFLCKYRGYHRAHPFLDRPMFTGPDGVLRNAYRHRDSFPPGTPLSGTRPGDPLGILRAPVIGMFCPDCGRRWDAFDDTSIPASERMGEQIGDQQ